MSKDKLYTTNYYNTFIEVAEDTKATCGTKPIPKGDTKTVAELQYDLIINNPYKFTSDDVIFLVYAIRNDLTEQEYEEAKLTFFSKGQACFRSSPLTKKYGFGVHADSNGNIAIYGIETEQYQKFLQNKSIRKVKALRSSRK